MSPVSTGILGAGREDAGRKAMPIALGREWDGVLVFNVEEAAKILRISRECAYGAVTKGHLPTIRLGRRLLVPRAALERLLSGEQKLATA
jgi:excisionase family DNA binding protein